MADSDLQTLGMLLRETREAHALSLEEVEEQTRIRVKFLRALESGDVSMLPSVAHAKGFLRNYAQFLRLDANAIIAQFVELTGSETSSITTTTAAPANVPPPVVPTIPSFEQSPPPESVPTPAVAPPTVPLTEQHTRPVYISPGQQVGPTGPLGTRRDKAVKITRPSTSKGHQAPLRGPFRSNWIVGGVLAIGMIAIVWWAIVQLSAISGDELIPIEQVSGIVEPTITVDANGSIPINQPATELSPTTGVPILDHVLISMTVTHRTWVRIVVDEEVRYEGQAIPGNILQYTGQQSIVVIAGNGAGLDVTYNGQEIGELGGQGEAVERVFTPSGQATSTATATLTPTSTSVPTATPRVSPTPRP